MSQAPKPNERKLQKEKVYDSSSAEIGDTLFAPDAEVIVSLAETPNKIVYSNEKSYKINILLKWLADPKTGCIFWKDKDGSGDIVGIRPVKRITIETINPNGFTPYKKETEENLFKLYLIDVVTCNDIYIWTTEDFEKREMIEQNGTIYLKSENIKYIYDFIRKNT